MLKFLGRLILALFFLVLAAGSIRWIRVDLPPRLAVFHWDTPFVLGFLLLPPFYLLLRGRFRLWETLEHEFTHALFATLLFKKLHRLDAGNGRGSLEYEGGRSLVITLAPYFFPTLALLPVLLKFTAGEPFQPWADGLLGYFTAYYLVSNLRESHPRQPDLHQFGVLFSYSLVLPLNLLFIYSLFLLQYNDPGLLWDFLRSSLDIFPLLAGKVMAGPGGAFLP